MFVCVLKSGGEYTEWHVKRLQEQLRRPLACLSDIPLSTPYVTRVPLIHGWNGWWSKLEVFRLMGPLVYLDLDVDIVGEPEKLYRDEFTMWGDPLYPGYYNSSVMSFSEDMFSVYGQFCKDPKGYPRKYRRFPMAGDQGFIQDFSFPRRYEDNLILSYKKDVKNRGIHKDAVVVAYHGKPKPWSL